MEVESSLPVDGEALELVQQGEGLLDDVAEFADADAVRRTDGGGPAYEVRSRTMAMP